MLNNKMLLRTEIQNNYGRDIIIPLLDKMTYKMREDMPWICYRVDKTLRWKPNIDVNHGNYEE